MIRNSAIFKYKSQDDDIPKDFFIENFDLKMVDLKMVTTHFDSLFRRLLGSTTETNCTVCQLKLSVADDTKDIADVIANHALLSTTFDLLEESC